MKQITWITVILALLLSACGAQQTAENLETSAAPEEPGVFGTEAVAPEESTDMPEQDTTPEAIPEQEPTISEEAPAVLDAQKPQEPSTPEEPEPPETEQYYVEIGGHRFPITLDDSPAAAAFRELLPATWEMEELHGNEKFIYLDSSLPSDARSVGYIETGDLMLYGDNCVVLFYDSFSTSYGYTRIGWVDNPDALPEIVGSGDITADFGVE